MPSMHANEAGHTWQGSCPQLVSVTGKALFSHWSLLQKHACIRVTTCSKHCHGIRNFAAKLCTADFSQPKRIVNKVFHLVMHFHSRLCLLLDYTCRRNTAQFTLRPKKDFYINIYLSIYLSIAIRVICSTILKKPNLLQPQKYSNNIAMPIII